MHTLPKIAVVVATHNRCRLLSKRALPSIAAQSFLPSYLVVVDDSGPEVSPLNQIAVSLLNIDACSTYYLENQRTAGASGSWNTALEFLSSSVTDPDQLLVAFLDDDDAWHSDYLKLSFEAVCESQLDMIAADLVRLEGGQKEPVICAAPERLLADDFLITNPGVQGSNLFLRLSLLLKAGCFDEELQSTTDRDLCIRLADLGNVRFARLPFALVDHFADFDRQRLSTIGSPAKLNGLSAFWRKYSGRMSSEQKGLFCDRASKIFGWSSSEIFTISALDESKTDSSLNVAIDCLSRDDSFRVNCIEHKKYELHDKQPFSLYVGVITSEPLVLLPLLRGLTSLKQNTFISNLTVIILDNCSSPLDLAEVISSIQLLGLKFSVITVEQQSRDAATGVFGTPFIKRPVEQVGIAQGRTMLQRYLGSLMERDQDSFGWILDDDMRVDSRANDYLPWLPIFRDYGIDVLIGTYEGSSPNPPLNGLRVNLVDLFHNLVWLKGLPDQAKLPDRSIENQHQRDKYPDYYYDLSRKHSGHLETPHWIEPKHQHETVVEARSRLLASALGILNGEPLTRPILARLPSDPLESAKDSVNRGGNTFILNPAVLQKTPNLIMRVSGREARRSDMMWAIVNRHYRGMSIKAVSFPVHHVGRINCRPAINFKKVQDEIIGSALYAGLTEFLKDHPKHDFKFSKWEIERITSLTEQHAEARLLLLQNSFYRIIGLRESIQSIVPKDVLVELLDYIDSYLTLGDFNKIRNAIRAVIRAPEIYDFVNYMQEVADEFSEKSVDINFILNQLQLDTNTDIRS